MKKTTSSLNKYQYWSFFPNCQKMTPEAANAVHGWHLDDKSKDVIDEGVQSLGKIMLLLPTLVYHHPPCRSSSSTAGGPRSSACSWWRAGWKIVTVLHISIINFSLSLWDYSFLYLRGHHDEAKGEEKAVTAAEDKAVPALVLVVDHTAMQWIFRWNVQYRTFIFLAPVNAVADC